MRIISQESFDNIQPLITENYANIHSRMALTLSPLTAATFAKYTQFTSRNEGQWSIDCEGEDDFVALTQADSATRDLVALRLQAVNAELKEKGFRATEKLLTVPTDACIFYRRNGAVGAVDVVLGQWGFKKTRSKEGASRIEILLSRAAAISSANVDLLLRWSDGEPIASQEVYVDIFGNSMPMTSDEQGRIHLGAVATGNSPVVELADGSKRRAVVTIAPDSSDTTYDVVFPRLTSAHVTCVDTDGNPVPSVPLLINGATMVGSESGEYDLQGITLTPKLELSVAYDEHSEQRYALQSDETLNRFTYTLPAAGKEQPPVATPPTDVAAPDGLTVSIRVLDKLGGVMPYVSVEVKLESGVRTATTDSAGLIRLPRALFTPGEKAKLRVLPAKPQPPATPQAPQASATPATPQASAAPQAPAQRAAAVPPQAPTPGPRH